ncbi:MAG TPA: hypothetical protein VLW55_26035 [Burkholderiaceae bacterium]|nr:hypothetical protein [Burkholderiaceae bacterium]
MTASHTQDLCRRSDLDTNGIAAKDIPGLFNAERNGLEELKAKLREQSKPAYSSEEIFGAFCHTGEYIRCPVDAAFAYMSNVYCLEEFTFSLRNFEPVEGGLYKGSDALAKDTSIYMRVDAYPDSRVIDHFCAWDQGEELWMRYHFRFLDAMPTVRRPGTIVLWSNCRHPYYDRSVTDIPTYISEPRARTDRLWVGDVWPSFYAIHNIEAANLKTVLEYRFGRTL